MRSPVKPGSWWGKVPKLSPTLELTVLTPEKTLLHVDSAQRVRVKLADGAWLSIYPKHAALLAEVLPGPLQYDTEMEVGEIALRAGILQIRGHQVVVMTSGVLTPDRDDHPENLSEAQRFERLARQLEESLRLDAGVSVDRASEEKAEA